MDSIHARAQLRLWFSGALQARGWQDGGSHLLCLGIKEVGVCCQAARRLAYSVPRTALVPSGHRAFHQLSLADWNKLASVWGQELFLQISLIYFPCPLPKSLADQSPCSNQYLHLEQYIYGTQVYIRCLASTQSWSGTWLKEMPESMWWMKHFS